MINRFKSNFLEIELIEWAELKVDKLKKYVDASLEENGEYIFITDIDQKRTTKAKKDALLKIKPFLSRTNIEVVVKEIECWYLAGLNKQSCKILKIKDVASTDDLTKESFKDIIPIGLGGPVNFMREILKKWHWETARQNNRSFSDMTARRNLI